MYIDRGMDDGWMDKHLADRWVDAWMDGHIFATDRWVDAWMDE